MMDKAINRDIEAQRNDRSNKMNLWKMHREALGDDMAANLATKNNILSRMKLQVDEMTGNAPGPMAQLRAQAAKQQIQTQMAQNGAMLDAIRASKQLGRQGNTGTEAEFQQQLSGMSMLNPQGAKAAQERYIPGVGVASITPTDKDREGLAVAKQIRDGLNELQARAVKFGITVPGSEADKVNKTKADALKLQMKNAFQLGVLSQSDLDMLDKLVANPGSWNTSRSVAQLEATKQSMRSLEESIKNKLGVKPFRSDKVRVSNGKKTFEIPEGDVAAAQKDGYRRIN